MGVLQLGTGGMGATLESKIRIKLGQIEVEFEGSEAFLKSELPELIRNVAELYQTADIPEAAQEDSAEASAGGAAIQLSTASIATKLGSKSGGDLAVAAAAHLTLVKNKPVFSRQELLNEMQTAPSFYKTSYSGNFTKTLGVLMKSKLNEPSSGKYSLTAGAVGELRKSLAG
jgi:hypothetical protein